MSQKALDLRMSMQIARRHKLLVGIVVALGILGGVAYAVLKPPMLSSTALVALQEPRARSRQTAAAAAAAPPPAEPTPLRQPKRLSRVVIRCSWTHCPMSVHPRRSTSSATMFRSAARLLTSFR